MVYQRSATAEALTARWRVATCSISTPGSPTYGASGGSSAGSPTVENNVPCRLGRSRIQPLLTIFGQQAVDRAEWALYLARGATIRPGATVTISGDTYTVTAVADDATGAVWCIALMQRVTAIG